MQPPAPRVTLAIATFNGERFLHEALASALAQSYTDYEVLVVDDGSTDGTAAVLDTFGDDRLRRLRNDVNLGIPATYNRIVAEARGELIARLGHDDVARPDWLERAVAVFDRFPNTAVAYGDAIVVDANGRQTDRWPTGGLARTRPLDVLVRRTGALIDPATVVHRRVYAAIGGYAADLPSTCDFDLWLRAARHFAFRHVPGGPVIAFRRHGGNFSDERHHAREIAELEICLGRLVDETPLAELVPEIDWAVLDTATAERAALHVLAAALDRRGVPILAERVRLRSVAAAPAPLPARRGSVLFTMFGFDDPGGGTLLPRLAAKSLAARGFDVTVFHAAVGALEGAPAYAIGEWESDGVRLIGVHNRPSALLDPGNPGREVDDPAIADAFGAVLDRLRPDVVHFHNLHNLGLSLVDETASRGIRSYFTPHNFWLACARNHFVREGGVLCEGGADGGRVCAPCTGTRDGEGYARRQLEMRERISWRVEAILPVTETVATVLAGAGFDRSSLHVQRLAAPEAARLWAETGSKRPRGRVGEVLTVGFIGSLAGHKGADLLVAAAQEVAAPLRVELHGDIPALRDRDRLLCADSRGVVDIHGPYAPASLPRILAGIDVAVLPSLVWETAGLTVLECLAAGVPVVVARMGGLIEGVRDGVDGLVVDGRSPAAVAAALQRLATEPDLLEALQTAIEPPRLFADYVDELDRLYTTGALPVVVPCPLEIAVRWTGDQAAVSSLATINREVTGRLGPGFVVERNGLDGPSGDPPLPRPADIEVRHQWPPDFTSRGVGRLALIQPWEFGSLPRDWQAPLTGAVDEVWVPSDYVAQMYRDAGVAGDRVHVVPNAVDLDRFRPEGARLELPPAGLRLLFVGGTIYRKGIDLLIEAFGEAFGPGDDVQLVVKDIGGASFYQGINLGERIRSLEASGRVVYIDRDLDDDEIAALYRACDVLVHPYRGEGFAMPVLEAMACGLPVVVTAGGPTDEFVPDSACWRVASVRRPFTRVGMECVDPPWMLEPDPTSLVGALRLATAAAAEREARGAAGQRAAQAYGWDAIAAMYGERLRSLALRAPRFAAAPIEPLVLPGRRGLNVLATPAWRGTDRLDALLRGWADAFGGGEDAILYLLADPAVDGTPERWEEHVLAAAGRAGVDLGEMADISVLDHEVHGDDLRRIHAAMDAYVPLHDACGGHRRLARCVAGTDAAALRSLSTRRAA